MANMEGAEVSSGLMRGDVLREVNARCVRNDKEVVALVQRYPPSLLYAMLEHVSETGQRERVMLVCRA